MFHKNRPSLKQLVPEETYKIIKELKRTYRIKDFYTSSGYTTLAINGLADTEVKTRDDGIFIVGSSKLPKGFYYGAYNPVTRVTYLYSKNTGGVVRIKNGAVMTYSKESLGSLANQSHFLEFVENDII